MSYGRPLGYLWIFFCYAVDQGWRPSCIIYACGGQTFTPHNKGNDRNTIVFMVKKPPGGYVILPFLSLEVPFLEGKLTHWSCRSYTCPPYELFFPSMQLTLHVTRGTPHGASRLLQARSAWSAKTRGTTSRQCKDATVVPQWASDYGHAWLSSAPLLKKQTATIFFESYMTARHNEQWYDI